MNIESRGMSGADYRNTKTDGSKDITKLLIGALAGAAAGSLIAGSFTQKGIEIRNKVGESSKKIAGDLKDKVSDISETIADKYESVKESAADLIEKGKQKAGISGDSSSYNSDTEYYAADTGEGISASQILLGAVIVSAASSIVWSFATEKGNQTRRRIAESGKNAAGSFKEKVSGVAGAIKDELADVYESAKEGAVDLLEQEKQKLKNS